MKRIVMIALLVFILCTVPTLAQGEEWTCDGGPNDILVAAQAAREAEDRDLAWELARRAEVLCISDHERYLEAQTIRRQSRRIRDVLSALGPGQVDLGEYSLHLLCSGEGTPTILFENGLGATLASEWIDVFSAVSTLTKACMYDRLGLFWSSPVPSGVVRTTQDQVDDLINLLEVTEIEGPYVMVGHSIAGLNILLMVDQYPDLVEGIVLVDASHPEQDERAAAADPTAVVPVAGQPFRLEQIDLYTSFHQAIGITDLGDRPLAVITAGLESGTDPVWVEMQNEYATYSTNSIHTIAETSGHFVMTTQPDKVIEAIIWVLDQIENAE